MRSYLFRFRRLLCLAVFTAGACSCEVMDNTPRSTLNDNTIITSLTGEEELQPPQSASGLLIGLHAAARVWISTELLMHHLAPGTQAVEC